MRGKAEHGSRKIKTNVGDKKTARKTKRTRKTRNTLNLRAHAMPRFDAIIFSKSTCFIKGVAVQRSSTEFDGRDCEGISTALEVVSKATPAVLYSTSSDGH